MAIGKCPKNKLLKGYIELELQLREFDRCRKLYEKYLEFSPENCTTWIKFAELETILGDTDRARGIFELAIGQPRLDMPEVMMSQFFCGQGFYGTTRSGFLFGHVLTALKQIKENFFTFSRLCLLTGSQTIKLSSTQTLFCALTSCCSPACHVLRCCGSPTLTLRSSRRSSETPGIFTRGCCSALSTSR